MVGWVVAVDNKNSGLGCGVRMSMVQVVCLEKVVRRESSCGVSRRSLSMSD